MRAKRSLVPRSKESNNRQLDNSGNDNATFRPRNDFNLNPNLKNVRLDRLRCYKKGKTVLRIWNMLDPEKPGEALLDGRLSPYGVAGLTGMSISEPVFCAQYAGITSDTLGNYLQRPEDADPVSYIIARNMTSTCEGVGFWDEPYVKLYVTAKRARDSGQFGSGHAWDSRWNALMAGQQPALSKFRQRHFVVCSLYENGDSLDLVREHIEYRKDGKDVTKDIPRNGIALGDAPADPLVVIPLPVSAGKKILQLCLEEKQDWQGNENENPSIMFKYGDPCGRFDASTGTVKGGAFFTLYNPEKFTVEKNTTYKGIINPQAVEYEAAISRGYVGPNGPISADLTSAQVDNVLSKHLYFWKENDEDPADSYLLHEPSLEERCVMIARAFRWVPKLLEFCWMSHPDYLGYDSVQSILNNRTVSVGSKSATTQSSPGNASAATKPEAPVNSRPVSATKASTPKSTTTLADEFESFDPEADSTALPANDAGQSSVENDFDSWPDEVEETVKSRLDATVASRVSPTEIVDDEFGLEETVEDAETAEAEFAELDDFAMDGTEEELSESADFDGDVVEDQLQAHLDQAKAIARSSKRTSPEPQSPPKPVTGRVPGRPRK